MTRTTAVLIRFGIRLLSLIIVGVLVILFRTSLATKDGLTPFLVLVIMVGLLIADIVEYFIFKRLAPNYQKFGYKKISRWICGNWKTIRKIPVIVYFFIGFLWKIIIGVFIPDLLEEGANISITKGASIPSIIFVALILAPLIETLLFQVLPIEISNKITNKCTGKPCVLFSIMVSALLFAVEHRFSIKYMCYAFVMGLYLSFFYLFISRIYGNNWKKGYAATVLLHFLFNFFAVASLLILNSIKGN